MPLPFLLLATALSSLLAGLGSMTLTYRPLLVILYSLGPAIAAFILKKKSKIPFEKISMKWLIASCMLPIAYVGATYLLGNIIFPQETTTAHSLVLSSIPIVLLAALLEEIGWRGVLFEELKGKTWIAMNVWIGVLWAVWHYPAILTGSYHISSPLWLGITIFTINVMLVSILFGWLRQKSGGIIAPTLAHTCHNLAFAYFAGTSGASSVSESGVVLTGVLVGCMGILKAWKK